MVGELGAPSIPHCRSVSLLGERPACTLYAADSHQYGGAVTISVYPPLANARAQRQFDAAVATARRLGRHPNLVTVHDSGETDDGRPYIVTDGHERTTAEGVLATTGAFDLESVLGIGIALAGALETAHRADVVHGGVAPDVVLLGTDGRPVLRDVGLHRVGQEATEANASLVWWIPYHAPPEALEGTDLTPATDVYSLASVLYTLLAGQAPRAGDPANDTPASLLLRILQLPVPPVGRPDVPPDLEDALRTALANTPGKRHRSILELAWALQDVQRTLGVAVTEPVVLDPASEWVETSGGAPGSPLGSSLGGSPGGTPAGAPGNYFGGPLDGALGGRPGDTGGSSFGGAPDDAFAAPGEPAGGGDTASAAFTDGAADPPRLEWTWPPALPIAGPDQPAGGWPEPPNGNGQVLGNGQVPRNGATGDAPLWWTPDAPAPPSLGGNGRPPADPAAGTDPLAPAEPPPPAWHPAADWALDQTLPTEEPPPVDAGNLADAFAPPQQTPWSPSARAGPTPSPVAPSPASRRAQRASSALARAREARMERQRRARAGVPYDGGATLDRRLPAEPEPDPHFGGDVAEAPPAAPARSGPPALPVAILVVIVMVLGAAAGWMVITGQDSADPPSELSTPTFSPAANQASNLIVAETAGRVRLEWDGPTGISYQIRVLSETEAPRVLDAGPATAMIVPRAHAQPGAPLCFDITSVPDEGGAVIAPSEPDALPTACLPGTDAASVLRE